MVIVERETEMLPKSVANVEKFRSERARAIRELAGKWVGCTFQLGKELEAVRKTFLTGKENSRSPRNPVGWEAWLDEEVGIGLRYAESLIQILNKFGNNADSLSGATFRVLQYLARDTIPEGAVTEVVDRFKKGEKVGKEAAKEIVRQHRPSPDEARKIARSTGKPTLASDGNLYLGATKEEEKQSEARRELVYGVRQAVETLAAVGISGEKFLRLMLPHQRWNAKEEHLLDEATDWLAELHTAWRLGK